jgi:Thioredoxin-like
MGKLRIGFRLLAALVLLTGLAQASVAAEVTIEQVLRFKPAQRDVDVSTPTSAEVASCTLKLEDGKSLADGKSTTAWVVRDAQGRIVRKFHDTTGGGGVNLFGYYKDGEEVYREMLNPKTKAIDQFRWVGPAGSRWGVDLDGDGKIDTWNAISTEELSQELLTAVVTKDAKRFEALLINKTDLEQLGLPKDEVDRIQAKVAGAKAQFQKICQDLKLTDKTVWVHLETKVPQTTPADVLDAKLDLVRYRHATILYQEGDGKDARHNWLQTGELIQVGRAWRVIQAPVSGIQETVVQPPAGGVDGTTFQIPPGAENLVKRLNELDERGPKGGREGLIEFNLGRAAILEQIAGMYTKVEDGPKRDIWIRQVADSYAAAAQQGDAAGLKRLAEWRGALEKTPSSPTLPYIIFREMSADYAQKLAAVGRDMDKLNKLQEEWKVKLSKFVRDYSSAEDTPDAILQLGMVNEFFGSKMEEDAKAAYSLLIKNFPKHSLAARAQGCLDRLTMEGKPFQLAAPTLDGKGPFNISSYQGKAVVVYYWASWNDMATSDFSKIKAALAGVEGKAVLVGVNLDAKPADAIAFLKSNPVDAVQVHMPGGLESPLAVRYGITSLPVMFLVGPDGKAVSRNVAATTIDDELRKLFKVPEKDGKDK